MVPLQSWALWPKAPPHKGFNGWLTLSRWLTCSWLYFQLHTERWVKIKPLICWSEVDKSVVFINADCGDSSGKEPSLEALFPPFLPPFLGLNSCTQVILLLQVPWITGTCHCIQLDKDNSPCGFGSSYWMPVLDLCWPLVTCGDNSEAETWWTLQECSFTFLSHVSG